MDFNEAELVGLRATDQIAGASHANVLAARSQLATLLQSRGRHIDAQPILVELLTLRCHLLGPAHPHTLQTALWVGQALRATGEYEAAEAIYRDAIEAAKSERLDAAVANFVHNLGIVLILQDKPDEAMDIYNQTIQGGDSNLDLTPEDCQHLTEQRDKISEHRKAGAEATLREWLLRQVTQQAEPQPVRKFVARSFEKALQSSNTLKEIMHLYEDTRTGAARAATNRNIVELGYPNLDDLLSVEEIDVFFPICAVCHSLNPWWRETAAGFKQKIIAGTPEFILEVDATALIHSANKTGCFSCELLITALKTYSPHYYTDSETWKQKRIKIRVKGSPADATLLVGARKTEMVQIFTPPGIEIPCAAIGQANIIASDTHAALSGVSQILKRCNDSHPDCGGNHAVQLPTRVIEIGPDNDSLRLAETRGVQSSFMTLSYCWGTTGESAKTTSANFSGRLVKLPIEELSKTHQDAINIVRNLGMRYLWIDGVCIIQDDKADWEQESVKMADYYNDSSLTIAAAASSDAQGGILLGRPDVTTEITLLTFDSDYDNTTQLPPEQSIAFRIPIRNHHLWSHCVTEQYFPLYPGEMVSLPLENRAWCLQERILSRRIVHFAKEEFFWECRQAKRCECGEIGGHTDFVGPATIRDDFSAAMTTGNKDVRSKIWMGIVSECTRRGIKYCRDRLPALSGIAQSLQRAGFGEYLAGIWKGCLIQQMLWTVDRYEAAQRSSPPNAPSWSWACIDDSSISFEVDHVFKGEEYTTIEAASCIPSSAGPFGGGSSGRLRLTAPVIQAKLVWDRRHDGLYAGGVIEPTMQKALELRLTGEDDFKCNFKPDFPLLNLETDPWVNNIRGQDSFSDDEVSSQILQSPVSNTFTAQADVELVPIIGSGSSDMAGKYFYCLVVRLCRNSSSKSNEFERVGLAIVTRSSSMNVSQLTKMKTIEVI